MTKKVAVVTGASRGMGLEWCRQLGARGYTVVLTARALPKAETAAGPLVDEGMTIVPATLDVSDEASIAALGQRVSEELGHVDVLVNNAGVNPKDRGPETFAQNFEVEKLDPDQVTACIRTNAVMPIIVAKHLLPALEKAERAVVVNISSWLGSLAVKERGGHYSYATSKTALNMMTRAFALQVVDRGIIAVAVNPGWVQTDMGGAKAKLTPEQSIRGMLENVVDRVTAEQAGQFLQHDGTEHPW